jgi:cell shape-determining protein MreC
MKLPSYLKGNNRHRSFPRATDRQSRTVSAVITLVFVFGGIFFIGLRFLTPGFFVAITRPILVAGNTLSVTVENIGVSATTKEAIAERDRLADQNEILKNENALLSARLHDVTTLLGSQSTPEKRIIAGVIARPPVAPYDVLVLDQGSINGVAVNATVSAAGGIPVGHISEVTAYSSRVTLYSMSGIATAGWIGANRFPVTFVGEGSGAFTARVPKGSAVAAGDGAYVVAGGAQPIGIVLSVDGEASSPTEQIHIRPYINPFSVPLVTITR